MADKSSPWTGILSGTRPQDPDNPHYMNPDNFGGKAREADPSPDMTLTGRNAASHQDAQRRQAKFDDLRARIDAKNAAEAAYRALPLRERLRLEGS